MADGRVGPAGQNVLSSATFMVKDLDMPSRVGIGLVQIPFLRSKEPHAKGIRGKMPFAKTAVLVSAIIILSIMF